MGGDRKERGVGNKREWGKGARGEKSMKRRAGKGALPGCCLHPLI